MKRLLALLGVAAILAAPRAAFGNDVHITFSPGTPKAGSTIDGVASFSVTAETISFLKSFTVTISGPDSAPPWSRTYEATRATSSDTFNITWDTSSLTKYNGAYRIQATAQSHVINDSPSSASISDIKVNNPPDTPSGVRAELKSNVPVVSWNANSEPDMKGYQILRSDDADPFKAIATVGNVTSYTDQAAKPGVGLSYRVIAVRNSPSESGVITASSAPTATIMVPAPPPSPSPRPEPVATATKDPIPVASSAPQAQPSATASTPASRQPVALPAPSPSQLELETPLPNQVVEPRRQTDLAFRPLLPYKGLPKQTIEDVLDPVQAEIGPTPEYSYETQRTQVQVVIDKARYIAAGLLLLVLAMHTSRLGIRLIRNPVPQTTSAASGGLAGLRFNASFPFVRRTGGDAGESGATPKAA